MAIGSWTSTVDIMGDLVYRLYLQEKDGKMVYQIPVNPEIFRTDIQANLDNYNVLNTGDIIRIRKPQLKTWNWDGVFLNDLANPLNSYGVIFPPTTYVYLFEKWMKNKTVLKFMVNSFSLLNKLCKGENRLCTIENFKYEDRGGEVGDIYYSIQLREYREYNSKLILTEGIEDAANSILNEKAAMSWMITQSAASQAYTIWTAVQGASTSLKMVAETKNTQKELKDSNTSGTVKTNPIKVKARGTSKIGIDSNINFTGDTYKYGINLSKGTTNFEKYKAYINEDATIIGYKDNYYLVQTSENKNVYIRKDLETIKENA